MEGQGQKVQGLREPVVKKTGINLIRRSRKNHRSGTPRGEENVAFQETSEKPIWNGARTKMTGEE